MSGSTHSEVLHPVDVRSLSALLTGLVEAQTEEDIYKAGVDALLMATAVDAAAILRIDRDGLVRFAVWRNISAEFRQAVGSYLPWQPLNHSPEVVVFSDTLTSEGLHVYRDIFAHEQIRAVAFVPLNSEAGILGAATLYCKEPHEFTDAELGLAQMIANQLALLIEYKTARAALAHSEGTLRAIFENSSSEPAGFDLSAIVESSDDAIISKNLNGIITSWNKGAERIFGYTAAEAIGKPVSMLAVPERRNEMPEILAKIRKGQRVDHYETMRQRKSGEPIHISLTVSPVRDASGRIIGASKIARDITDRKRIEKERDLLLFREQEARRAAELLNRLGPMLLTELDTGKLVQAVTDLARELIGAEFATFFRKVLNEAGESYPSHTLSGTALDAEFPMPRDAQIFGPTFGGQGVVISDDLTQDTRYCVNAPLCEMPEGHPRVRSYLAVPVKSRSGEVLGGLFLGHSAPGRFRDEDGVVITGIAAQAAIAMDNARLFEHQERIREELKRSNQELRRVNQDLETFAYSASHDLQEPLRTIAISAQLLDRRHGDQLQQDGRRFLDTILQGARRMENLIRDILAYATAGRSPEGPAPAVDAAKILSSVLESLKAQIDEAGATVISGPLPTVSVHQNHLTQLFQNLISNGLKYQNKEAPVVEVSAAERDNLWVFSVADNGIGIESQFADQIFGLFKRLHSRDKYPGSGIGLAICQRIVEQYGGRVWLEHSQPGEGSTFCFSLPGPLQ